MSSTELGLGDLVAKATSAVGVRPCGGCARRAATLNRLVVLAAPPTRDAGGEQRRRWRSRLRPRLRLRLGLRRGAAASSCWSFTGRCTGFGSRQCVEAPASQDPDAETVTQCCNGWFQYPWIEVCPGQPATTGCGFCLW
jgi:hypothetical protein